MDESSRIERFTRRLTLAAAIGCVATGDFFATPVFADPPSKNLRSLLAKGWAENASPTAENASPKRESTAKVQDEFESAKKADATSSQGKSVRLKSAKHDPTRPKPAEPKSLAAIIRPKLSPVPETVPPLESSPKADKSASSAERHMSPAATVTSSLAELIKRRSRVLVVPPQPTASNRIDPDDIRIEQRPTVERLNVKQRAEAIQARLKAISQSSVQAAKPIADPHGKPQARRPLAVETAPPKPSPRRKDKPTTSGPIRNGVTAPATKTANDLPGPTKPEKQLSTLAEAAKTSAVPSTVAKKSQRVAEGTLAGAKDAKPKAVPKESTPKIVATKRVETIFEDKTSGTLESPIRSQPDGPASSSLSRVAATPKTKNVQARPAADAKQVTISDQTRQIAENDGFALLPLKDVDSDQASELVADQPFQLSTIHATRLQELAIQSLRKAADRFRRQATHSAKKYTLESLRLIVSMRDAQTGGNQHARQLDQAFDALRESKDFCGRFGPLDQNAIQRMVDSHETQALKDRDIKNLSALEATEAYLNLARENLVRACGGVSEACDALVLLGKIEKQMARPGETHGAAVAVTLQRAAVVIEPNSSHAYGELGATLMQQGLIDQAALALQQSVEMRPTRIGYQRLLEVSRRLGDADTARRCVTSLQKPDLQDSIRVKTLSPVEFAATHRPQLASIAAKPASPNREATPAASESQSKETSAIKVSSRSLFPFGRR